jgi:hypothetical protein
MRVALAVLLCVFLIAGCVHGAPDGTALDVRASAAHELAGDVAVRITNVTGETRCIHADLLENLATTYVAVRLRRNGRNIQQPEGGFLLPPKRAGLAQLAPGESATFDLNVPSHFSPAQTVPLAGLEARIGIGNWPCSNPVGGGRSR